MISPEKSLVMVRGQTLTQARPAVHPPGVEIGNLHRPDDFGDITIRAGQSITLDGVDHGAIRAPLAIDYKSNHSNQLT